MKGIYYFEAPIPSGITSTGVREKISKHIQCLKELGDLTVVKSEFGNGFLEKIKFLLPGVKSDREKKMEALLDAVKCDTNYIYIRKPSLSIKFYYVLRRIKRRFPNICIIMEIPTYPFHNEYTGISKLTIIKSLNCEKKLKRVIDGVLTYSMDDEIWGIPTIKMSNCVSYDEVPPRSKNYKLKDNTVRMTCVADFMYWHGLDRLINGMKEYNGGREIVLNVVGNGEEISKLKELSFGMRNVVFHGEKSGENLDKTFDETDIAVDALGRHRSGVYYNSSLKGKEYAARGIPIISGVKTEFDNMRGFSYYMKFPSDDSYINIADVVKFYDRIYSKESPESVTVEIRKSTERMFDYEYGFKLKMYELIKTRLLTDGKK